MGRLGRYGWIQFVEESAAYLLAYVETKKQCDDSVRKFLRDKYLVTRNLALLFSIVLHNFIMGIQMHFNLYSIHIDYFLSVSHTMNWSTAENLLYILFYIFRRRWLQTLCLLRSRYYYSGDEWIRRLHDNRMWWSLGYGNPNECNCLCVQPTSDWQRLVIRKKFCWCLGTSE